MIRSIASVIDDANKGQDFVCALLEEAQAGDIFTYLTVLTTAPLISPRIAPLGSLYIPENELRGDALDAVTCIRAAAGIGNEALLVKGLYGDVAWLAHDLRNDDDVTDLIVIGPTETWSVPWLRRRAIETLLLSSGTPLLLLPKERQLPKLRHVTLGWKPCPQAVHTAHALVSLAEPGAKVDIVTVEPNTAPNMGSEQPRCGIADFFRRHGFEPECHWVDETDAVETVLQDFALASGADALAVGGFAHSRVREIMLGGVTHSLVDHCRLPVLMAH